MASPLATTDWQSKRLFEDTNEHMLQNEDLCDVTFLVGTSKMEKVKAHKFILASRSPVFYSMFCGTLAESSNVIKMPDIEPSAFREFLRFIYTEDCELNEESIMALLYSSKKYLTVRLTEKCIECLNNQISKDNVFIILQCAHNFDEKELADSCLKFVLENGDDVLQSDRIVSVSKEVLQIIIDSDDLDAEEISVYNACKTWANHQCKNKLDKPSFSPAELRDQLGDLIYSVRFPTLSTGTFTDDVYPDKILTDAEVIDVYQHQTGSTGKRKCPFTTSVRKRTRTQPPYLKLYRCYPVTTDNHSWKHDGCPDAINFTVSRRATLLGVSLFAPKFVGTLTGHVSILDGTLTMVSRSDVKIVYDPSKYEEELFFDSPAIVETGKEYTIYALLKGSHAYKGTHFQQKISSGNLHVSFAQSDKSSNGTSILIGQIPSLIFENEWYCQGNIICKNDRLNK